MNLILTATLWCWGSCLIHFPAEVRKRETKGVKEGHPVVKEQKGRNWAQELLVQCSGNLASELYFTFDFISFTFWKSVFSKKADIFL